MVTVEPPDTVPYEIVPDPDAVPTYHWYPAAFVACAHEMVPPDAERADNVHDADVPGVIICRLPDAGEANRNGCLRGSGILHS